MDKSEFIKQQFKALREEIKETKSRIFKLAGFGILGVPATNFLGQAYQIDILIITMPLLVIAVAFLFLAENKALMRCGKYIKDNIESNISGINGWEHWLEDRCNDNPRSVDKFINYFFNIIFLIYYLGSFFIASKFIYEKYGIVACSISLGGYVGIGAVFLYVYIKNIKYCTTTD